MKIAIIYTSLIHYRKSFFQILVSNEEIDYRVIYGDKSPYDSMKNFESLNKSIRIKNKVLKVKNHSFVYQFGLIRELKKINPEAVVLLGVDLHLVSNLFLSLYLKTFTSIKIVWWGHGTFGNQGSIGKVIRNFFYKLAEGVFLYSQNEEKNFNKIFNQNKIHVINNAINLSDYGYIAYPEIFKNKKHLKDKRKTINIFYVGRLVKEKKIELLLEAYSILLKTNEDYQLTIIGEGKNKKKLIDLSLKYSINDKTTFTGALYGNDLNYLLLNMDICVNPGYLGLSGIHVNSFGIPMITNDKMSMHSPEINFLEMDKNGSLFENDNVNDLVNHINYWGSSLNDNFDSHVSEIINLSKQYSPEAMVNNFNNGINSLFHD